MDVCIAYKDNKDRYIIEKYTGEQRIVDILTLKKEIINNRAILGYKINNDKLVITETDDRMFLFKAFIHEYKEIDENNKNTLDENIISALDKLSVRAIKMLYESYMDIYKTVREKYTADIERLISITGSHRTVIGIIRSAVFTYDWSKGQLYNINGIINSKSYSYLENVLLPGLADYSDEFCDIFVNELKNRYLTYRT